MKKNLSELYPLDINVMLYEQLLVSLSCFPSVRLPNPSCRDLLSMLGIGSINVECNVDCDAPCKLRRRASAPPPPPAQLSLLALPMRPATILHTYIAKRNEKVTGTMP